MTENKTLVAYFSATGTTESLAKKIATATGGELYKITPEAEYSAEDLDWTVETSRCCKENADPSSRPALREDQGESGCLRCRLPWFPELVERRAKNHQHLHRGLRPEGARP